MFLNFFKKAERNENIEFESFKNIKIDLYKKFEFFK